MLSLILLCEYEGGASHIFHTAVKSHKNKDRNDVGVRNETKIEIKDTHVCDSCTFV